MSKLVIALIATSTLALSSCTTTTKDSVSGVNRSQFMLLPSGTIDKISSQAYAQTLGEAKAKL